MLLSDCLLYFYGARVLHLRYALDLIVAQAIDMYTLVFVQVGASHIAEEGDCVELLVLLGLYHIETIGHDIGVLDSPRERLDLLDGDVAAKVVDLGLRIEAVALKAGEIKELGAVVNLLPEALLHLLLGLSQLFI